MYIRVVTLLQINIVFNVLIVNCERFFDFGKKFSIKIPIWPFEIKLINLFFEKLRLEKTIPFIDQMVSLSSVNKLDDMAFSFEFNKLIPRNEQIIIKE